MTPERIRAASLHLYTASGGVLALLATMEICLPEPDPRLVFVLLAVTVLIDATDGPLARKWEVKRWLPEVSGRVIDDIVDFLTYTFVPLLLVWRMGWLPQPAIAWLAPALVASLLGFANAAAKDEVGGFFLGFPSYWNVVAFYAGIIHRLYGPWPNAVIFLLLALLTVLPVRFLYPNLAPMRWRGPLILGALVWLGTMLWMLVEYPRGPSWLTWISLLYPAFYLWMSFRLGVRVRP